MDNRISKIITFAITLVFVVLVVCAFLIERPKPFVIDNSGGDECPKCHSTNIGKFFYGLYEEEYADSATIEKVEKELLIPGGCGVRETSPKYRCNDCHYTWGQFLK